MELRGQGGATAFQCAGEAGIGAGQVRQQPVGDQGRAGAADAQVRHTPPCFGRLVRSGFRSGLGSGLGSGEAEVGEVMVEGLGGGRQQGAVTGLLGEAQQEERHARTSVQQSGPWCSGDAAGQLVTECPGADEQLLLAGAPGEVQQGQSDAGASGEQAVVEVVQPGSDHSFEDLAGPVGAAEPVQGEGDAREAVVEAEAWFRHGVHGVVQPADVGVGDVDSRFGQGPQDPGRAVGEGRSAARDGELLDVPGEETVGAVRGRTAQDAAGDGLPQRGPGRRRGFRRPRGFLPRPVGHRRSGFLPGAEVTTHLPLEVVGDRKAGRDDGNELVQLLR